MWYEQDGIKLMPTWVRKENIIDVVTLTSDGSYVDRTTRRWTLLDSRGPEPVAKVISVSYKYGFDSDNYRHAEVLNKYISGEYVALMSQVLSQPEADDWDGDIEVFQ